MDKKNPVLFPDDPNASIVDSIVMYDDGIYKMDPGADTWTATVDYGDGSGEQPLTLNPDKTFNLSHTYADNGTYTVIVKVADDDGGEATGYINIIVNDLSPKAEFAWQPEPQNEGSPVQFNDESISSPDLIVSWLWDFGDNGTSTEQNLVHIYANNGIYHVSLTVTDDDGSQNTISHDITILNVLPLVEAGNNQEVYEGASVSFSGSFTDPGTNDPHTITWLFGDGSDATETLTPIHTYADNKPNSQSYEVKLIVTDDIGAGEDILLVKVNNLPPEITSISATMDPVVVGGSISAIATFTDAGTGDTHTATWNWGDGNSSAGTVSEANGSGSATGNHTYASAGVYTLTLTVTDDDGDSDQATFQFIVIYDPSAGFVTGGGWINSPEGAYVANPSLTGKANFGFVSKYEKGANVPTGNTQFNFKVADLNFHSTEYDWLVVAGAKAQYKGSGKINNSGNYGFMLSAIDGQINGGGGVDKFRIKIWDKNNNDSIVYDNLLNAPDDADPTTVIGGGSIVIHKDSNPPAAPPINPIAKLQAPSQTRLLPAFPNPFNPEVWIPYQLAKDTDVIIKIYNASGSLVRTLNLGYKPLGVYDTRDKSAYWDGKNEAGERVSSGVYFYTIQAGEYIATKKMVMQK